MPDIIPKEFVDELKIIVYNRCLGTPVVCVKINKAIDALVEKYNKRIETYWKLDLNKGEK